MIYAKSFTNNINNSYSEKIDQNKTWPEDCSTGSCVNIGNIWVYTKFGYVDRNSVAYLLDTDISGNQDTKVVTNNKTKERITVPARNTTEEAQTTIALQVINRYCARIMISVSAESTKKTEIPSSLYRRDSIITLTNILMAGAISATRLPM